MTSPTIQQQREIALADLQWIKEAYGPNREKLLERADYREAAWRVVELNAGLVRWVLRPYLRPQDAHYDDLVNELTLSAFQACYNWEPSLGKFTTYAAACMKGAFYTQISEHRQMDLPMRLPRHLQTKSSRDRHKKQILDQIAKLRQDYPEAKEHEELSDWWRHHSSLGRALAALEEAENIARAPTNHTRQFKDEDGFVYGEAREVELVADDTADTVEEAATGPLEDAVDEVLSTLTEREARVLRLRFGLDDDKQRARTLEEVGRDFGVTPERIRQIEGKALRRLRHPSRSRKLKDFLDGDSGKRYPPRPPYKVRKHTVSSSYCKSQCGWLMDLLKTMGLRGVKKPATNSKTAIGPDPVSEPAPFWRLPWPWGSLPIGSPAKLVTPRRGRRRQPEREPRYPATPPPWPPPLPSEAYGVADGSWVDPGPLI